jgi:short-subunit dehydrogenase
VAERMRLSGRTAVITGAGGGIGRAIAVSLARRGCRLALVDVKEEGLAETAELVRASGVRFSLHLLDVTDREGVAALPDGVRARHPGVELLVNNAGVALGGTFEQLSAEDFEWLFEINFWGVVRLTRAFLPLLHAGDEARIVNVSSVFGLIAPAGQSAYSASKFAVRGFSEALRHELDGSRVGVTVVHPGGVATAIAASARMSSLIPPDQVASGLASIQKRLRLAPEAAGETIVRGIERRRPRVLVGSDAVAISILARLLPVSYWKLLASRLRD